MRFFPSNVVGGAGAPRVPANLNPPSPVVPQSEQIDMIDRVAKSSAESLKRSTEVKNKTLTVVPFTKDSFDEKVTTDDLEAKQKTRIGDSLKEKKQIALNKSEDAVVAYVKYKFDGELRMMRTVIRLNKEQQRIVKFAKDNDERFTNLAEIINDIVCNDIKNIVQQNLNLDDGQAHFTFNRDGDGGFTHSTRNRSRDGASPAQRKKAQQTSFQKYYSRSEIEKTADVFKKDIAGKASVFSGCGLEKAFIDSCEDKANNVLQKVIGEAKKAMEATDKAIGECEAILNKPHIKKEAGTSFLMDRLKEIKKEEPTKLDNYTFEENEKKLGRLKTLKTDIEKHEIECIKKAIDSEKDEVVESIKKLNGYIAGNDLKLEATKQEELDKWKANLDTVSKDVQTLATYDDSTTLADLRSNLTKINKHKEETVNEGLDNLTWGNRRKLKAAVKKIVSEKASIREEKSKTLALIKKSIDLINKFKTDYRSGVCPGVDDAALDQKLNLDKFSKYLDDCKKELEKTTDLAEVKRMNEAIQSVTEAIIGQINQVISKDYQDLENKKERIFTRYRDEIRDRSTIIGPVSQIERQAFTIRDRLVQTSFDGVTEAKNFFTSTPTVRFKEKIKGLRRLAESIAAFDKVKTIDEIKEELKANEAAARAPAAAAPAAAPAALAPAPAAAVVPGAPPAPAAPGGAPAAAVPGAPPAPLALAPGAPPAPAPAPAALAPVVAPVVAPVGQQPPQGLFGWVASWFSRKS